MGNFKTHYDNLKVSRSASAPRIRLAYRKLAQKYHPDKFAGSSTEANRIMRILNDAKTTLLDPVRRQAYDLRIHEREQAEQRRAQRTTHGQESERTGEQSRARQAHRQHRARAAAASPRAERTRRSETSTSPSFQALFAGAGCLLRGLCGAVGGATHSVLRDAPIAPIKMLGQVTALIAALAFTTHLLSDPAADLRLPPAQVAAAQARTAYANSLLEEKPSAGYDLDRSPKQIRYCLSEAIRLEAIKNALDNASPFENDRLDSAIEDHSTLCRRYTYRANTFEIVKNDVAAQRPALAKEGLARLNAWRQLAPHPSGRMPEDQVTTPPPPDPPNASPIAASPETLFPAVSQGPSNFSGDPFPGMNPSGSRLTE